MAKDPAVLFYTSDFITGTITMSDEQRGQYIMLLCLQHQKGFLSEKDMLKICGAYDEVIWEKFDKEGEKYINKRMQLEAEKRRNYCESRAGNRKGSKKDKKNISKTYEKHMENENEDVIINKKEDVIIKEYSGEFFEVVQKWLNYKAKIKNTYKDINSIKLFIDKLKKLSGNDIKVATEIVNDSMANNYKGIFEPKDKPKEQETKIYKRNG